LSQFIFGGNSGAAMSAPSGGLTGEVGCPSRDIAADQGELQVDFFARLDSLRERWNVLEHPFYQRWSDGSLEREELAFYAGEYRHAVIALAEAVDAAARASEPEHRDTLSRHAEEEAQHVELWDGFASALDADVDRAPRAETQACRASWTAGRDALENLVAAFTIESGQPAIARTKLDGLVDRYGFEEGPATEYFSLHAELDHEHAAQSRELIEERLADADLDRLLEVAEGVLRGNWQLLDGCDRAAGAE
jgi:pyrroloquinoline-quinone synthase